MNMVVFVSLMVLLMLFLSHGVEASRIDENEKGNDTILTTTATRKNIVSTSKIKSIIKNISDVNKRRTTNQRIKTMPTTKVTRQLRLRLWPRRFFPRRPSVIFPSVPNPDQVQSQSPSATIFPSQSSSVTNLPTQVPVSTLFVPVIVLTRKPVSPTKVPTQLPTTLPTTLPTISPTISPTLVPIVAPVNCPIPGQSLFPTNVTSRVTSTPAKVPTLSPTAIPMNVSTIFPTSFPMLLTRAPASLATTVPVNIPSNVPLNAPTAVPATAVPATTVPVPLPMALPTINVTKLPSYLPTKVPTIFSTKAPVPVPIPTITPVLQPIPVPVYVPDPVDPTASYNATLQLIDVPDEDRWYFTNATRRWNEAIRGGIPETNTSGFGPPLIEGCAFPEFIDDLFVCAAYEKIDEAYGVLGYTGIDYTKLVDGKTLPIAGKIVFDVGDVPDLKLSGSFDKVILHELGHIVGIGALWIHNNLVNSTSCKTYYGTEGNRVYKQLSGCATSMPLEQDGGPGTTCAHLDETCFRREVMTGFFDRTAVNPFSVLSIAVLKDLGYSQADYTKADQFVSTDLNDSCRCNTRKKKKRQLSLLRDKQESDKKQQEATDNNGLNRSSRKQHRRRQLSESGKQRATDFGVSILQKHQALYDDRQRKLANADETHENIQFVGGETITVLYEEDNEIYGIAVTNNILP